MLRRDFIFRASCWVRGFVELRATHPQCFSLPSSPSRKSPARSAVFNFARVQTSFASRLICAPVKSFEIGHPVLAPAAISWNFALSILGT